MTKVTFTLEIAFNLHHNSHDFPVDFDYGWQWLGYTQRHNAKESFLNCGFVDGVDFTSTSRISTGGRPAEKIYMTIDCFKMWAMLAKTEQGVQVRKYFLECERRLKARITQPALAVEAKHATTWLSKDKRGLLRTINRCFDMLIQQSLLPREREVIFQTLELANRSLWELQQSPTNAPEESLTLKADEKSPIVTPNFPGSLPPQNSPDKEQKDSFWDEW